MKEEMKRILRLIDDAISTISPEEAAELMAIGAALLEQRRRQGKVADLSTKAFLVKLRSATFMVTVDEVRDR
jgi:hypothetical protein